MVLTNCHFVYTARTAYLFYLDFAADIFTGRLMILGEMGGGERLGERGQVRDVLVCMCMCAHMRVQGRWRDRVRYIMHYESRLCRVVMFHV